MGTLDQFEDLRRRVRTGGVNPNIRNINPVDLIPLTTSAPIKMGNKGLPAPVETVQSGAPIIDKDNESKIDPMLLGGILSIGGSLISSDAAGDASDDVVQANQLGINEQRRQFDTILNLQAPQINLAGNAANRLNQLLFNMQPIPEGGNKGFPDPIDQQTFLGKPVMQDENVGVNFGGGGIATQPTAIQTGVPTVNTPGSEGFEFGDNIPDDIFDPRFLDTAQLGDDFFGVDEFEFDSSGILDTPAAKLRLAEAKKMIQNLTSASGNSFSGQTLKALSDRAQDIASDEIDREFSRQLSTFGANQTSKDSALNRLLADFNAGRITQSDVFNRLASATGLGQTGVSNVVSAAQNTGNNIADLLSASGSANAAGELNQADAITGGLNNLMLLSLLNNPTNTNNSLGGVRRF